MSASSDDSREDRALDAEPRVCAVEQERALAERRRMEAALAASEERYRCLFEDAPISLWEEDFSAVAAYFEELRGQGVTDVRAHFERHPDEVPRCAGMVKFLRVNQTTISMFEADSEAQVLANLLITFGPESLEVFREELIALAGGATRFSWSEAIVNTVKGRPLYVNVNLSVARGSERTLERIFVSLQDVTERRRAEDALRESMIQEAVSRAQVEVLTRLAAPLIPISDELVVMPLIGAFDEVRTQHMTETLLRGVAGRRASIAILDITGMTEIDAQVADTLLRAAHAVRLLGARVVLTGIRPEAAQVLVTLGTDLSSVVTRGTLQDGIAYAMSAQGRRGGAAARGGGAQRG